MRVISLELHLEPALVLGEREFHDVSFIYFKPFLAVLRGVGQVESLITADDDYEVVVVVDAKVTS
jgi:hypothetical protein